MNLPIPEGWTESPMRELGQFFGGSTPATTDGSLWGGTIPWLVPSEISGLQDHHVLLCDTATHLTQKGYDSCSTRLLPRGAIAVSSRATVGDCIIMARPICTNQGFVSIVCNSEKIYNLFLFYWVRLKKPYICRFAAGTTFDEIGRRTFKNLRVLHPTAVKEQRAIARAIASVDKAINSVRQTIAAAQRVQTAFMQQLLTGLLRPDGTRRQKHEFVEDKEFGLIPRSWRSCKFKDLMREGAVTEIQDGNHGEKHPTQEDYVREGIPFIMACDISSGEVDLENAKKIPKSVADGLRIGFSVKGDVLLSHKASIGFTAIVGDVSPYIMLTPQVTYYRCDPDLLLPKFLHLFFRSYRFQAILKALSLQSTRSYIGITSQKKLPILYPPDPNEQKDIADALGGIDQLISAKRAKVASLQHLKKSLMQNLLSGRIRLPAESTPKKVSRQ